MSDDPVPYATPVSRAYSQSLGRQVFGVIVRTVGLLLAIYGGHELVTACVALLFSGYNQPTAILQGAFCVGVGLLLLLKGGRVVHLSYGRDD
jgi:hypothetical protein